MNRIALPIILLALWILLGSFFCHNNLCNEKAELVERVKTEIPNPIWTIRDGASFTTESSEFFNFQDSKTTYLPISEELNESLNQISRYLISNPLKSIAIKGSYLETEQNPSALPTIGLARANNVKNALKKRGVPTKQLSISDVLATNESMIEGVLKHGINFQFNAVSETDERLEAIKLRLLNKPMMLHFNTGENQVNLTTKQRTDFADMIYYLDKVESGKIKVGGHTDAVGNRAFNINLSQDRSDFIKKYCSQNLSVSEKRIDSKGFGPDKPIANNDTEEGRKQNRRVEVTLN